MYTCLDIYYVVGIASHYQSNPKKLYWKILRYLKGITNYYLCYQEKDLHLGGYLDVNWADDLDECESISR